MVELYGENDFTVIRQTTLKNNVQIKLLYRGGGATAPDVIWVQKTFRNQKSYIGKIKWSSNSDESNIWQVNDSIIRVRLTDTLFFKGQFRDFTLNLNDAIYPNDGSAFAE